MPVLLDAAATRERMHTFAKARTTKLPGGLLRATANGQGNPEQPTMHGGEKVEEEEEEKTISTCCEYATTYCSNHSLS